MTDLEQAIYMVYESVKSRLPLNFAQFKEATNNWEFTPLKENGEVIGAVMAKDNELHIGYGKKPQSSILRHIRKPLKMAFEKYGYVVTSVMKDNKKGLNFCKRIGFIVFNEENDKILLRCDRSKYV